MGVKPTLYLYNSTGFKIRKVDDETVMSADPNEQAHLLYHILTTALPNGVVQKLWDLMSRGQIREVSDAGK